MNRAEEETRLVEESVARQQWFNNYRKELEQDLKEKIEKARIYVGAPMLLLQDLNISAEILSEKTAIPLNTIIRARKAARIDRNREYTKAAGMWDTPKPTAAPAPVSKPIETDPKTDENPKIHLREIDGDTFLVFKTDRWPVIKGGRFGVMPLDPEDERYPEDESEYFSIIERYGAQEREAKQND